MGGQVDINSLLTILTGITTVAMSFGVVKTSLENLKDKLKVLETRVDRVEASSVSHEKFELVVGQMKNELAEVKTDLKEILRVLRGQSHHDQN